MDNNGMFNNENYGFSPPSIGRSISGMAFDQYLQSSNENDGLIEQTKMDLTKNICLHVYSLVEKYISSTLTINTYNDTTNFLGKTGNGIVSDLKDKISEIHYGGGTDFNKMIEFKKKRKKK